VTSDDEKRLQDIRELLANAIGYPNVNIGRESDRYFLLRLLDEAQDREAKIRDAVKGQSGKEMPTSVCEPAYRTAAVIFEEMEYRLAESGLTRCTDKCTLMPVIANMVQLSINEHMDTVRAALDASPAEPPTKEDANA